MYQNNPSLRSAGEVIEYTQEQIAEWVRCKEDIIYFAEHYCYIVNIDLGRILIPLREYQKRMLKAYMEPSDGKRHLVVLSGRQSGKCCFKDTKVKIRNKTTGEVKEINICDFKS